MTFEAVVSCVVPAYNAERYLEEALSSTLAQTHPLGEIIVVDDGSTDATARVADGFGPPVRCIRQPNGGPASAINRGLREAVGEFLAVLAADDVWPENRIARQLDHFRQRPDLDISVGHVANFWEQELAEEAERLQDHRLSRPIPGYTVSTMLARRSVFESVGCLDPARRHSFSTDWFLKVREHGVVVELLPEVLLYRRMHLRNRSRQFAARSRSEYIDMLKQSLDRRRGC